MFNFSVPWVFYILSLIKSAFFETDEGDDDGEDIEAFADYATDGEIVHVMYYPDRGAK